MNSLTGLLADHETYFPQNLIAFCDPITGEIVAFAEDLSWTCGIRGVVGNVRYVATVEAYLRAVRQPKAKANWQSEGF